ncbi:hypothetical protein T4C_10727 [Trichinella pseudospiralis]|uniref:Transducer of regulated CREB activity N-terminal domain-containing protein n=1 Tax=Trichinella pseudospiralis TaxID=6337 RepID=A0A0V1JXH6_TRIPS|nr:hypothetical protein T4C_10727 [Trichinella pseudospiralis]
MERREGAEQTDTVRQAINIYVLFVRVIAMLLRSVVKKNLPAVLMASGIPRKFSEKIAIQQRKLNEDQSAFEQIMAEVHSITRHSVIPIFASD